MCINWLLFVVLYVSFLRGPGLCSQLKQTSMVLSVLLTDEQKLSDFKVNFYCMPASRNVKWGQTIQADVKILVMRPVWSWDLNISGANDGASYHCCLHALQWCSRDNSEEQDANARWSGNGNVMSRASFHCRSHDALVNHSASMPRMSSHPLYIR